MESLKRLFSSTKFSTEEFADKFDQAWIQRIDELSAHKFLKNESTTN